MTNCNKTTTYAYLALLTGSWSLQENGWCELFWACGDSYGAKISSYCVLWHGNQESQIVFALWNCLFWCENFAPVKTLALILEKLQGVLGAPPVSHSDTLPYEWRKIKNIHVYIYKCIAPATAIIVPHTHHIWVAADYIYVCIYTYIYLLHLPMQS